MLLFVITTNLAVKQSIPPPTVLKYILFYYVQINLMDMKNHKS